ncbi:MAG: protein-disulfide reductase DsbD domain-containing protein [bacterium]
MKNRILFASMATTVFCLASITSFTAVRAQTTPPKIQTKFSLAPQRVQRGRSVRGSVLLDIPAGYHVNAHDPISRFALATKLEVETPKGMKIGRIFYPKAIVRRFTFSKDRLGVYENHAAITFTIFVPLQQPLGEGEIKARLSYQSCSDEVCFPPVTREIAVAITVN